MSSSSRPLATTTVTALHQLERGEAAVVTLWRTRERLRQEPADPSGSDGIERLAQVRDLAQLALESLPAKLRRVLSLRYLDGLTRQEVSARLGVLETSVSRLLARAIDRLRTDLAEHADDVRAILDQRTERNPHRFRIRRVQRLRRVRQKGGRYP